MRNHIARFYTFKKDNDDVLLTIEEHLSLPFPLPVLQGMPSANEECRRRSYTFKIIDEIVLTIEDNFNCCIFRLLIKFWRVSCEKKC